MPFFHSVYLFAILSAIAFVSANDGQGAGYGLDCSFPMHSYELSCGDLLGDRKAIYDEFMQGCREKWGEKGATRCDNNEEERLAMIRRQPQSIVVSVHPPG